MNFRKQRKGGEKKKKRKKKTPFCVYDEYLLGSLDKLPISSLNAFIFPTNSYSAYLPTQLTYLGKYLIDHHSRHLLHSTTLTASSRGTFSRVRHRTVELTLYRPARPSQQQIRRGERNKNGQHNIDNRRIAKDSPDRAPTSHTRRGDRHVR